MAAQNAKPQKPKFLTRIEAQFEALQDAGLAPRFLALSLPRYQELLIWTVAEESGGSDDEWGEATHPEAMTEWRDLDIVILPITTSFAELTASASDVWEHADDFLKTMEAT